MVTKANIAAMQGIHPDAACCQLQDIGPHDEASTLVPSTLSRILVEDWQKAELAGSRS
jgi:hypothetical protein